MDERLARIYLDDHLAVLAGAEALVRRMLGETRDAEIRGFLDELLPELADDLRAGEAALVRLGGRPSRLKQAAARAGERLGRLKGNGNLRGYSPLTRVLELEGLAACLASDRALWQALELAGPEPEDAGARAGRADARLRRAEELRLTAARVALLGEERRL